MKHSYLLRLLALLGPLALASATHAQAVGIGTTSPTQALDVNGQLRVRGLSGLGGLPQRLPDGTLGLYSPAPTTATDPLAAKPTLLHAGSSTTKGIVTPTNKNLQSVAVSGSSGVAVGSTGRVGIGIPALLTPTRGPHNMAAVAYGTCLPDGTLSFSSGNVVVSKRSAGAYSLSITGKDNPVPYALTAIPTSTGLVGTFVKTTLLSLVAGSYFPSGERRAGAVANGFGA